MITITPTPQQYNVTSPTMIPNLSVPPPGHRFGTPQRFHGPGRHNFFQPFRPYGRGIAALDPEFDGKRLRKSAMRKTVDYNSSIIKMLEGRVWQRDFRDRKALQPDTTYIPDILPPPSYEENAINAVTTRFVKTATNKMRCPVFCMAWTPEGRRLITGASSGEFTLWNGLTFNFETILQAHDSPVRTMVWSHNDVWMVTADHTGYVKYWQSNMNSVKVFLAHKEAIRGISFSPNDSKFATCSDDGTIRIWDFLRCHEERILRGHGADVKCVHWHPQKGLVVSGSKDNQQPVKLWDPKTGQSLATLHAHKSTVMDVKWNKNGNWLVTASRDHLLKLFDIRNLSSEVQTFRGHKKESSSVAWHPYHEGLFCSGGSDGAILFWHVGADKEVGAIEQAHDSIVWTLAWHPLGHILCSGSNDHTSKFWTRNRPGDQMRDKYNLNTLPANIAGLDENDLDDISSVIPGMGPEDKVDLNTNTEESSSLAAGVIPGLDIDTVDDKNKLLSKKVPFSKPIPKNFQAQWNETGKDDSADDSKDNLDPIAFLNSLIEKQPGVIPLSEIKAEAILIYGRILPVESGSVLAEAISGGAEKLYKYVNSGAVSELRDVMPYYDLSDEEGNQFKSDDEDSRGDETRNQDYNEEQRDWGDEDIRTSFQGLINQTMMPPPPIMGSNVNTNMPPQLMQSQIMGFGGASGDSANQYNVPSQPQMFPSQTNRMPIMGQQGQMTGNFGHLGPMFTVSSGGMNEDNSFNMGQQNNEGSEDYYKQSDMNRSFNADDGQRYRSDRHDSQDRPSRRGRGRGGYDYGGNNYGNGRSQRDTRYNDDDGDHDDGMDDDDDNDEDRYGNGDYGRDRGRDRRWDDRDSQQDNFDDDIQDDFDDDGGGRRDSDNRRGRGSRGRFGFRGSFNRGSKRGGKFNKRDGFDRPWRGSRGRGGSRGRRNSPMRGGYKN